jgi:hypothetical protein
MNKNRQNIYLLLGLVLVFGLRVLFLDRFPIGITHDELNYIFSAKSLFLTHTFPSGTAPAILPTSMENFTVTVAEVPAFLLTPFVGPIGFSLFSSRVMGAFLSTAIAWALFLITRHLTKKKSLAFITLFLYAVNPWSFLMGRTVFEGNFFVAFFLWGFWVLIKNKGWKMFYAFPLFLLGFFSYTGGQVAFFLFVIITLIYHYSENKDKKRNKNIVYLVFTFLITVIFIGYFLIALHNQSFTVRGKEIYLPTRPEVAQTVDEKRKLSVSSSVNNLFINKATVFLGGFTDKYLNAFSVNNLFLKGEARAAFSLQEHGTFYLIDLFFIIIGLCFLFNLNKKAWVLVLAIVLVSPLTSALNIVEYSYSQRAGLMYPFLIILAGIGVGTVIGLAKHEGIRKIVAVAIIGIYLLFLANLLHIYFYRFPVYASDGWFFQDRLLARYIHLTSEQYPDSRILVFSSEPKIVFEGYLFYTNLYNKSSAKSVNTLMNRGEYSYNNVTFIDKCPTEKPKEGEVIILDSSLGCDRPPWMKDVVRITRLKDVYENYLIYNDKLCNSLPLGKYVAQSAYANFAVEKESSDKFCLNWITKIQQ